jgi:hypothetical protein
MGARAAGPYQEVVQDGACRPEAHGSESSHDSRRALATLRRGAAHLLGAFCPADMFLLIRQNLGEGTARLLCTPPTTVRLEDTTSVIDSPTNAKAYLHEHSTVQSKRNRYFCWL